MCRMKSPFEGELHSRTVCISEFMDEFGSLTKTIPESAVLQGTVVDNCRVEGSEDSCENEGANVEGSNEAGCLPDGISVDG
jgi:hypothetical protein